jgi:hypothetical protein
MTEDPKKDDDDPGPPDDGLRTCRWCLWDITQDIETRRWRLGWGEPEDGEDPFECDGNPTHAHEPTFDWILKGP